MENHWDSNHSRALKQRLESLAAAGVTQLPKASATRSGGQPTVAVSGEPQREPVSRPVVAAGMSAADSDRGRELRVELRVLHQQVADCTKCGELAAARTNTVFGTGPADARICFFGEAPGADEDASGEPFVGRAGQLLTKIIEACSLRREDVYILNVLKCRPPGNRPPAAEEVANCRPFFERQFEVISPEYICCLGTSAAQALLKTVDPIGRLRKRWFTYGSAKVICTYHPSYLLRNPAAKRDVWDDMRLMMADMGVNL
ncbi:MAG: uracil-DNA glycosylase [Pirellulales bacterium]